MEEVSPSYTIETTITESLRAVFGPVATKWFQFLQNRIKLSTVPKTLAARVAADQLLCAPTMIGVFLSSMSIMEGSDPKEKLQRTYWEALRANWTIWPVLQGLNLFLVPLQYRVLSVNVFNIGMLVFLPSIVHTTVLRFLFSLFLSVSFLFHFFLSLCDHELMVCRLELLFEFPEQRGECSAATCCLDGGLYKLKY